MKSTDQQLRDAAKALRDRIGEDLHTPYIPFVETGIGPGRMRQSKVFGSSRLFIHPLKIITSDCVIQKKRRSRQKPENFWARQWRLLWDHNPWPYSLVEYYEVDEPAMVFDRANNCIVCHPAIEQEIKKCFAER